MYKNLSLKQISVYIASIILVVLSVGIGVMLYLYFSGYVSSLQTQTEEKLPIKSIAECSKARIDIYSKTLYEKTTWLNDFKYRIPITIKENSENDLNDYQVLITIDTKNLTEKAIYELPIYISSVGAELIDYPVRIEIANTSILSKISDDGRDIRFFNRSTNNPYSDTNGLLNYWIEKIIPNRKLVVLVKVPYIPASEGTTIYMYYGNYSANKMEFPFLSVFNISRLGYIGPGNYVYIKYPSPSFIWINRVSTTSIASGDDVCSSNQSLQFDARFYGETSSKFAVSSNGVLFFTEYTSCDDDYFNYLDKFISWRAIGFWSDLRTDIAGGTVLTPGVYFDSYNDFAVITWEATLWGDQSTSIKFQIILNPSGNIIFSINNATNLHEFFPTVGISKGDFRNYIDISDEIETNKTWFFLLYRVIPFNLGSERIVQVIFPGKMRSDCGDIRFTDSDGTTLLPYWIEKCYINKTFSISASAYYSIGTECIWNMNNFPSTPYSYEDNDWWTFDPWSGDSNEMYVRINFEFYGNLDSANLEIMSDDGHAVWINGYTLGSAGCLCHCSWTAYGIWDITEYINQGQNEIRIWCSEGWGDEYCYFRLRINGIEIRKNGDYVYRDEGGRFWVKVPNIPANRNKTIYMYYGNPSATSMSNGDLVFEFFDDFPGTSLNTSKWIVSTYQFGYGFASYSVVDGYLYISTGATATPEEARVNITTRNNFTLSQFELVAYINYTHDSHRSWGDLHGIYIVNTTYGNWHGPGICVRGSYYDNTRAYPDRNPACYDIDDPADSSNFDYVIIRRNSTHTYMKFLNIYEHITTSSPSSPFRITIYNKHDNSLYGDEPLQYSLTWIDYIFLRKYISPEPLISLGREEINYLTITLSNTGIDLGKKFQIKLKYEDKREEIRNIELNKTLKVGDTIELKLENLPKGKINKIEIYCLDVCPNLLVGIKYVNIEV